MTALSIVIPIQNRIHVVKEYIHSVLNQTVDAEIIIVDYMSNDNLEQFIKTLKHNNLRLLRVDGDDGFNISKARNVGISAAKSDIIFTLDCDVLIRRTDAISQLLIRYHRNVNPKNKTGLLLPTVGTGNMFFYKSLWEKCGKFPQAFKNHGFEDSAFIINAERYGGYLKSIWPFNVYKLRKNNKYFWTVKPIRGKDRKELPDGHPKGYIKCTSKWEDSKMDPHKVFEHFKKNPDAYKNNKIMPYREIKW